MANRLKRLVGIAAMMAAAGLGNPESPLPAPAIRPPLKRSKGESPKCKSCISYGTRVGCNTPTKMACDSYKRRNKRKK